MMYIYTYIRCKNKSLCAAYVGYSLRDISCDTNGFVRGTDSHEKAAARYCFHSSA